MFVPIRRELRTVAFGMLTVAIVVAGVISYVGQGHTSRVTLLVWLAGLVPLAIVIGALVQRRVEAWIDSASAASASPVLEHSRRTIGRTALALLLAAAVSSAVILTTSSSVGSAIVFLSTGALGIALLRSARTVRLRECQTGRCYIRPARFHWDLRGRDPLTPLFFMPWS